MSEKKVDSKPGMSFADMRLIPGVVINNSDSANLGRVKAYSPGLFDTKTMDEEALPWIYPFSMSMYQSFSTQAVNSKIWIIFMPDNPYGYFYLPFPDYHTEVSNHIKGDSDIVFSRESKNGGTNIYYNENEGLVLKNGGARVQLLNNGKVVITNSIGSGMNFVIADGKCYSGGGEEHEVVLGDKLKDALSNLSNGLSDLATQTNSSPYTSHLTGKIQDIQSQFSSDIKGILSDNCVVS